jgi:hypothetical protein
MTRTICRTRLLSIVLGLGTLAMGLAGCKGFFGSQGVPHDPMFLDKQPIEAKPRMSSPQAPAFAETTPPLNPYLAAQQPGLDGPQRSLPGTLTNRGRAERPEDDNEP